LHQAKKNGNDNTVSLLFKHSLVLKVYHILYRNNLPFPGKLPRTGQSVYLNKISVAFGIDYRCVDIFMQHNILKMPKRTTKF